MNITQIRVWDFAPLFRDGPYKMSFVTQINMFGRILQIETEDGFAGLGEIVFYPTLAADQREILIEKEATYLQGLIGQPIKSILDLAEQLRKNGKEWHGVTFGLETAAFDILARRRQIPLSKLWSESQANSINNYFSISERTVKKVRARLKLAGKERRILQLKTGVGSVDNDISLINGILKDMSSHQTVLVDANGGWSMEQALQIIGRFNDSRIVWEDPCESYEDNLAISGMISNPVMFDMCARSPDVVKLAVTEPTVASICIKPASLGSLRIAQQIRDLCADSRKKMRIDGPFCGDIASAAILHMAVGAPSELMIAGCDLREPLAIEVDLGGVVELPECRIAPPPGHGLGIDLNSVKLGQPARTIL